MSDDDGKIVGLRGEFVELPFDMNLAPDQLFRSQEIVDNAPVSELRRMVIVGEDEDGNLYVSSTHHSGFASLLLGKAQHLIHSKYQMK